MVFTAEIIALLRGVAEELTGIRLPGEIDIGEGEGLEVSVDDQGAVRLRAQDAPALLRGMVLASRALDEGRAPYEARQHRRFRSIGPMLDVSRGAVLKPEAVRGYIERTAALGMNLVMLYTEDTYTLPDYPHFGWLRGRYSPEELRGLDAYAALMGVELVPCIQTLGHLSAFLQWPEGRAIADQRAVLMIDDEATYRFIEAEIAAMRACLRARRIHIGMDEADGVGLGRYFDRHGATDRNALLARHLTRVVEICRKYGFEPMMWSDMFFRLNSPANEYYDPSIRIGGAQIPADTSLVYWDYYHTDADFYRQMLRRHAETGRPVAFAGGVWTWRGFLPHVKRTLATTLPAMRACDETGVDTVLITMWGDDGAETDLMLGAALMAPFSEACWAGADVPEEEVRAMGAIAGGLPWAAVEAFGALYPDESEAAPGKAILWCDPLYPLVPGGEAALEGAIARADAALEALAMYGDRLECAYAAAVFGAVREKAALLTGLRAHYRSGDRAWLQAQVETGIPALAARYAQLMGAHRALWRRDNKPFGWEVLCGRYGGAMARLTDLRATLADWLAGNAPNIPELEEPALDPTRADFTWFHQSFASPAGDVV